MEARNNGTPAAKESIYTALARPFDVSQVKVRALQTTKDRMRGHLAFYIDARDVLDRLDEVVGPENWHDEYQVLGDGIVMCRLSVAGVTKSDVGTGDDFKSAFSDSLKRAAVRWGIARYLYSVPSIWGPLDERGNVQDPEEAKRRVFGLGPKPVAKRLPLARHRPLQSSDELAVDDDLPF